MAAIEVSVGNLTARLLLLVVALALVGTAPARAQSSASTSDQRTITVTGIGAVTAANDTALLSLGVSTTHTTAALAIADTSTRTRRVLAALGRRGIAAEDIQTDTVGLRRTVRSKTRHRKRQVVYTATNSVSVTVRSVATTGAVIGAAVKAGATRVSGIEFFPSNETGLYRQALVLSYDDAREKAELLARRAGVTLGAPISIVEGQDQFEPAVQDLASNEVAAVPIAPGNATIFATVTVVFAIS
jgi:uncharacterized protein YggE